MTEQDTQTGSPERGASVLFPDTDAETWAEAERLAAVFNRQFAAARASEDAEQEPSDVVKRPMVCDADDVLLAGYLTEFGRAMMRNPATRTKAMHRLYDDGSPVGPRCLIGLAKAIRRLHASALPIEQASLDFTATLAVVAVAPDQRAKFGKHPGG
jgi:hypothetical protein